MSKPKKPKKPTKTEIARKQFPIEFTVLGETFIMTPEAAERLADEITCAVLNYRDSHKVTK